MPRIKIRRSVFTRLLVVILLAGVGINLALIFLFGAFRHQISGTYQAHLTRYVGYLMKDLGTPPDLARARRIASQTNMVIAYDSPNLSWTTARQPLDLPLARFRLRHQHGNIQVSSYRGTFRVVVADGEGRLTFLLLHQPEAEKNLHILGIGLLLYVSLLMVGAYLVIRRILRPLRWLRQGVGQVARGELSHRVPAARSDELGELAAAFNTMTDRIGKLIQSREQLLLDVSHELRSPITRMKVALAMMPESQEKQNLEEDLREMEAKITELLETARAVNVREALDLQETDVMQLIKEAVAAFQGMAPGIQLEESAELFTMDLDRRRMGRAIGNILDNALKYSAQSSDPVQVSLAQEDSSLVIAVNDHGIGIPEEDLDFVFDPFFRVDKTRTPRTGGYGLGLSLAKTIVEAHGGDITIRSTPGHGTTVCIALPK